ncbi:hypothetical protein [Streptomyces sp. SP17KL33]|uniref:hypothetical protein n=1 Tax=Streptomyces sp. SP17KL33 TaxID=3002534 RepID=UPI002E773A98|nr:hypothetical protein [Streptomyces sp. SP17KL33]MEE1838101.1 hypothetical protein [Streptomyces sp. SP17KL33]
MPKKQPFAAKLARRIQAATGLSYTDCLKMYGPVPSDWTALARELRAVGLVDTADNLLNVAAVNAEAGAWFEAGGMVQGMSYDTEDYANGERVNQACADAAEAALNRAGFETYGFDTEAEAYHCAFLALAKAGTMQDGRALALAAVDVFDDDPLYCSDIVRDRGRAPFTYGTAAGLAGPETPFAIAARKAARAVAAASAVRTGGDEGWYEAAGHMVEAVWYGCAAAGLPPLHERKEYRLFYQFEMDRTIPEE